MKYNSYGLDLLRDIVSKSMELKNNELTNSLWGAEDGSELEEKLDELHKIIDDFVYDVNNKMADIDMIIKHVDSDNDCDEE